MSWQGAERLRPSAVAAVAGAFAVSGLYLVNPNSTHLPLCPLHAMTGLCCPLCGATRASWALLHGHPVTALHDNALYVLALPLLLLIGCWRLARPAGAQRALPRPIWWGLLVGALAFGIVRNLPAGSWLAPPA